MKQKWITGLLALAMLISLCACGAKEETPEEYLPETTEATTLEPIPANATDEEWQQMYQEVLQNPETYANLNGAGKAWLMDVDGNGIPELYICRGADFEQILLGAYDAATGELHQRIFTGTDAEEAQAPHPFIEGEPTYDVYFGTEIFLSIKTGERMLRGTAGGSSSSFDFILKPNLHTFFFERIDLKSNVKDWDVEAQEPLTLSENYSDSNIYVPLLESAQPGEPLLLDGVPDEEAVCDFLGLPYSPPQAEPESTAADLHGVPYIGSSAISMSAAQAKAFAQVIQNHEAQATNGQLVTVLTDGGGGIPLLWLAVESEEEHMHEFLGIWQWNGSAATQITLEKWCASYVIVNGTPYLIDSGPQSDAAVPFVMLAYPLANGQIAKTPYSTNVRVLLTDYTTQEGFTSSFYESHGSDFYLDIPALFETGVIEEISECIDGVPRSRFGDAGKIAFWDYVLSGQNIAVDVGTLSFTWLDGPFSSANDVRSVLQAYAD